MRIGKQRLSKAEREALAAAESEKRRAKEARAKMVSMLIKITTWVLILIAGILLSIFAEKLLQWTSLLLNIRSGQLALFLFSRVICGEMDRKYSWALARSEPLKEYKGINKRKGR
eukprot:gene14076-20024_t